MRTRPLGNTKIQVSELSLGTWGLSGDGYGPVSPGEARRVIDRARAMGIDLFETANSYADGSMETTLGEALDGKEATVVTKWGTDRLSSPPRKRFDAEFLRKSAQESRKRLGEKVTLVALLHNPSEKGVRESDGCSTMRQLCDEGVIQAWGVSAGDEHVAQAALDAETQVLSLPYNILQVQPLRSLEPIIEEQKVGVLAHSVLFYGLLAGRWHQNKRFRPLDHRSERWPEGVLNTRIRHLDAIRPMVSGDVATMRSAAVRFVLSQKVVSSVVMGPRNGLQLDQLVRENSSDPPYLSEGKLSALEGRLKNLEIPR